MEGRWWGRASSQIRVSGKLFNLEAVTISACQGSISTQASGLVWEKAGSLKGKQARAGKDQLSNSTNGSSGVSMSTATIPNPHHQEWAMEARKHGHWAQHQLLRQENWTFQGQIAWGTAGSCQGNEWREREGAWGKPSCQFFTCFLWIAPSGISVSRQGRIYSHRHLINPYPELDIILNPG